MIFPMSFAKTKQIAEFLASVAIVVVAVVIASDYLRKSPGAGQHPHAKQLVKGSLAPEISGLKYDSPTLLLIMSPNCHFCRDSAHFYATLYAQKPHSVRFVAAAPQLEAAKQYLSTAPYRVDGVVQANASALGVRGTPTLLLVAAGGTVTGVWNGKQPPEGETQVLQALKGFER